MHGPHQYAHKLRTTRCPASARATSTADPSAAHSTTTPRNAAGPGPLSGGGTGRQVGTLPGAPPAQPACRRRGVRDRLVSGSSLSVAGVVAQLGHQRRHQRRHHRQDRNGPTGLPGRFCPAPYYSPARASKCSVSGPWTRGAASSGSSGTEAEGRAVFGKHADTARRFAGVAHPAAVEDHSVAQHGPLTAFDQFPDRMLHLDRVLFSGPAPPPHQPTEMSVDGDSRDTERIAQDDVGGLAPHSGQRHQLGHGRWHLAVEPLNQGLPEADERGRLVAVEASGTDEVFQFGAIRLCVIQRRPVLREYSRRRQVHPFIGALRRKNGGHRQLERRA